MNKRALTTTGLRALTGLIAVVLLSAWAPLDGADGSGKIDLRLTKRVDRADVTVGEQVNFIIEVTNLSSAEAGATGVVVADLLPDGLAFVGASQALTQSGQKWTWNAGSIARGETVSLTITAVASRPGQHVNCAQVWEAGQEDRSSTFGNGFRNDEADDDCAAVWIQDPGGRAMCYVVADNDNRNESRDVLSRIIAPGIEEIVGSTGTRHLEGLAFEPASGRLFGSDGDTFGRLSLSSGDFHEIGKFGSGTGASGFEVFSDVDGLTFDPFNGDLYASVRRTDNKADLLIKVDPATGDVVEDAFGPGTDYVVIGTVTVGSYVLDDVDDIAIDSWDGRMYGIVNRSGEKSHLVIIDKTSGAITDLWDLDVENVEGLGFTADHVLLGVLGDSDAKLVTIDMATGITSDPIDLGLDLNQDYESVACLTDLRNLITGTVFFDTDQNGVFGGDDVGHAGVAVSLFRDGNADGLPGHASDVLLTSVASGPDGSFAFQISSIGHFLITSTESTYPAGTYLTTTNLHTAAFAGFGLTDTGNDFGFYGRQAPVGPDLELSKTVDRADVAPGSSVTFTITVTNTGTVEMTGIVVEDQLPAGLQFEASWTSQGSYDESTGLWDVGSLWVGGSATLDIQARIRVKAELVNVAEITHADQDDIDSTPNNGVETEDDYGAATVSARSKPGFSPAECTDMGTINALVYDPVSGQLFAGTETGVVHVSDDGGRSWPPFLITDSDKPIKDIVLSPAGTVFAVTLGRGVYVSNDAGYTWESIGPWHGKHMDAFYDVIRGLLYVASKSKVWVWNGWEWSIVGESTNPFMGQQVNDVAVDMATGKIYASSNGAGLRVFAGGSWMPATTGLPRNAIVTALHGTTSHAYVGIAGGGVYRMDAGVWQPFGTGVETQTIVTLATGATGQLLLGTADQGAYFYDSSLGRWINAQNLPTFTVSAITSGPLGELYAGTPGQGVFTFVDQNGDGRNDTWHHIAAIVANAVIQDLVAAPSGELFAATYGYGILYSIDGGNCWMRINRGLVNLYTYAIERASDGTLYIGIWADGKGGVWRSSDNGRSWQFLALGNRQIISLAIDPGDENVIYAGANLAGEGALFKSTDGGMSWRQLGGITTPVWSIEVHPDDSDIVTAGTLGAGIFRSRDGGRSFVQFGNQASGLGNGYVYDLQYAPHWCPWAGELFAATARGVYIHDRSHNRWELFGSGSETFDIRTIAFIGNAVFAGTWGHGVLRYNYRWGVWEDAGFGQIPVVAFAVVESTQTLVVGTNGAGLFLGEDLVEASAQGTASEPDERLDAVPSEFRLGPAYPNPFNPRTTIPYAVAGSARVRLAVYDVLGRQVALLADGLVAAGEHEAVFDAASVPSGAYVVRLESEGLFASRMVTLLK